MLNSNSRIFNEYLPVNVSFGKCTVKLNCKFWISALCDWKKIGEIHTRVNIGGIFNYFILERTQKVDQKKLRITHFILGIVNVLGPETKILLNVATKSGPRLKWMLSNASGSSGTVWTPSPKLPVANDGRNLLISSKMHFSGAGRLREHVLIIDAVCVTQKKPNHCIFLLWFANEWIMCLIC